jgi:PAS domain S-box-containing protein
MGSAIQQADSAREARRAQVDALVAQLAGRFVGVSPEETDAAVVEAIGGVAGVVGADRAVYVRLSDDERTVTRTHAWGAEPAGGAGPDEYRLGEYGWLVPLVRGRGSMMVADLAALPDVARAERDLFVDAGVRSVGFVTGRHQGWLDGAIVLQWWNREPDSSPLEPLCVVADLIAGALRRSRAERALRESEERFRSMANALPVNVRIADARQRLVFANEAYLSFEGTTLEEAIGSRIADDQVHPDDRERLYAALRDASRRRAPLEIEFRARRADGEWRSLLAHNVPQLSASGAVIGYIGSAHDVTEHRRLEEQLREAQKMEAVGRLAGGIAHDFNNILTAIVGHAECSRLELLEGRLPFAEIEGIERAAQRASGLTRQLLAFARRQVIEPRVVDLNPLLVGLEAMLRRLLPESVALEIAPASRAFPIRVDPSQLEQVLVNLAVNACDAMPAGGTLRIEASECVAPGSLGNAAWAVLSVADTGSGMDAETAARAFEPFFTTKEVGQGTGLGLATCYGIVRQAGGEISLRSALGRGTVVEVRIPLVDEDPASASGRAGAVEDGGGRETILLVEDEAGVRELCARTLRRLGYAVLVASDGADALAALDKLPRPEVDLLVTDMVMPHASGAEVAARVRAAYPAARVLYISGYSDALMDGAAGRRGGAFLAKPFTPRELAAAVRRALDGPS